MPVDIVVPEVGESIVDARVSKWLKKEGDLVEAGEPLVELETDKIDVEVSAPKAGVLEQIAHGDGDDVKIGAVLGRIGDSTAAAETGKKAAKGAKAEKVTDAKGAAETTDEPAAEAEAAAAGDDEAAAAEGETPAATPSARRMARERDVELRDVRAEGPRVTRRDVERSVDSRKSPEQAAPATPAMAVRAPATGERNETRVRMSKRRATIARRLVEVQQTAALLTTFNEVDMSAVMALRQRHKESFKERHGTSLGIASFFVKATVAALRDFPRLNAEIDDDYMVLKQYYDVGIAVAADEGLVVPVLRDADRMSFAAIEAGIRGFAKKAQDGTLTLDDLRGGTFSITNGGVFGSLMSTPILNPPQVGILGLHAIQDRPVGIDGRIELRPMMYIALTYDHRIVDGSEAVRFLVRVKGLVEDPAALLMES
jgi:2-oxoglutarate dehydrogenase E2 component (dihydrolipoamide succinyltransferase)